MSLIDEWGYEQFCSLSMITKQDILDRISKERIKFAEMEKAEEDETLIPRYAIIDRLFSQLYNKVDESYLFSAPAPEKNYYQEGVWRYNITLDASGVRLYLSLVDGDLDNQDRYGYISDDDNYTEWAKEFNVTDCYEEHMMIEAKSRLLTVEEYAELYGVKIVTVRQWIRRGKIRSAIKIGGEWRIPELASVPNIHRGYKPVNYVIETPMTRIIEGFDFINDYGYIQIKHRKTDNKYEIRFVPVDEEGNHLFNQEKTVICDIFDRERFELYLIGSGNVKCDDGNDIHYYFE